MSAEDDARRDLDWDLILEIPNDLHAIERAVQQLILCGRHMGFPSQRLRLNLRVGVSEALSNAMLYGNDRDPSKRVRLEASVSRRRALVRVTDEGHGFDPEEVPDPTLPEFRTRVGGRGLFLIRELMDGVEFNERGNSITMVLDRDPPEGSEELAPASDQPADQEPLPESVVELLRGFESAHGPGSCRLWRRSDGGGEPVPVYPPDAEDGPPASALPIEHAAPGEELLLAAGRDGAPGRALAYLADSIGRVLVYEREARLAAREIGERYEEINLLYTISEILGSVISLGDAADRILAEVADVLSARRASLWLYDPERRQLERVGGVGAPAASNTIAIDDVNSLTARVFRDRQPLNLEQGTVIPRGTQLEPRPKGHDAVLAVPITYSPPEGVARTVGVIALVGRKTNVRFTAGDARMLAAIASQVGAVLETQRLMQESMRRERIVHELELAHNLQLKLLPDAAAFEGAAEVAARCAPADSVGGDFYHLFRLSGGRIGVMIGDVSSHGFGAALIMALTMSAVAIYAQEGAPPAEVLKRVHEALIDELESTEMYMTLCYAVVDPSAGTLVWANAGHAHAFRMEPSGRAQRLGATDPPLGILPSEAYGEDRAAWCAGEDLLCLFTDGLSDALASEGAESGEDQVLARVRELRDRPVAEILDGLFALVGAAGGDIPADDRSAVVARI